MTADSHSYPHRLRRLDRIFPNFPIYFVTTCTHKRHPVLSNHAMHESLRRFGEVGEARGAWVGAYVIMPDHLHLFVAFDDREMMLQRWMKSLKNALSKTLRKEGVSPPHWQKGFFDHVLRSDESYSAKWDYVRDNPVRAGIVENWKDWPYQGEIYPLDYRRL
jgi:putative transposase